MTPPPSLTSAASFTAGGADSAAFSAAFASGQVYAQRPPPPTPPGLLAVGGRGSGYVLVFTSLDQLARYAGECDWLRTTGADLLALLPDGYGLLVDPVSDHSIVLPSHALRRGGRPTVGDR